MFGFLIKKSFFNYWDNMLTAILVNIGFLLCSLVLFAAVLIVKPVGFLPVLLTVLPGFFLIYLYIGSAAAVVSEVLESGTGRLKNLRHGFSLTWKKSILIAVFSIIVVLIASVAIPFYMLSGKYFGIIAAALIFCIVILWFCSVQYFYPLIYSTRQPLLGVIKTSLMFAVENPLYSFGLLLMSVFLSAISIITFLLIPGVTSVLILHQNALKLRLYKYEWIEMQTDNRNNKIPWAQLLEEDREKLGKRTLKGMFFPGKE